MKKWENNITINSIVISNSFENGAYKKCAASLFKVLT